LHFQDETIEMSEKVNAQDPDWHKAMVNANIDIFEMSNE
jgi:hypothetical protein